MAPKKRPAASLNADPFGISDDDEPKTAAESASALESSTAATPNNSTAKIYDTIEPSPPSSTVHQVASGVPDLVSPPMSPLSNRDKYMALTSPVKVSCSLSTAGLSNPTARFDFQAIVLVAYPACDKPVRRHVALVDSSGATGITVWSNHVPMFDVSSVGHVVKFTNLSITTHNGRRSLAMSRDSSIKFLSDSELSRSSEHNWWTGLLQQSPLNISNARSMDDDMIVTVSGVLFLIQTETKKIRDELKDLVTIRLADTSGFIDVRSWNHTEEFFRPHLEKPIVLQRVRITSFAGNKLGEMLDGGGTILRSSFSGSNDLAKFWNAPVPKSDVENVIAIVD
jgi:hypothetical protein